MLERRVSRARSRLTKFWRICSSRFSISPRNDSALRPRVPNRISIPPNPPNRRKRDCPEDLVVLTADLWLHYNGFAGEDGSAGDCCATEGGCSGVREGSRTSSVP